MQFAIDQGLRQFHIGAGVGGEDDGLFKFKSSFGGRELEFGVSGQIIDQGRYKVHVQNRAKDCNVTPDELLAANSFPAYRAGALHA